MQTFKLDNAHDYFDIYELTGFAPGTSLIVTNNTGGQIRLSQSEIKPSVNNIGFPVWPNHTALMHGNNIFSGWIKGGTDGYIIVQELSSTIIPFTGVEFPQDIVTSGLENFRRLQVEDGDTGLYEGRDFREIQKIRLGAGDIDVYKFTSAVEFVLEALEFTISDGRYEATIYAADNIEETIAVTTPVPFLPRNLSSTFRDYDGARYQSQVTITTGGAVAVTDPTLFRDYVELRTSTSTSQQAVVSAGTGSQRLLPPGTFYVVIENIGNSACRGTSSIQWEEFPDGVK